MKEMEDYRFWKHINRVGLDVKEYGLSPISDIFLTPSYEMHLDGSSMHFNITYLLHTFFHLEFNIY